MFHGHVRGRGPCSFLVMVVSVGSGLYVGPGPRSLLRAYPESGSRELGGFRSVYDQEVNRRTKVKNNPRSMTIFPEKNVTMAHAEICWVQLNCVRWVEAKSSALSGAIPYPHVEYLMRTPSLFYLGQQVSPDPKPNPNPYPNNMEVPVLGCCHL